MQQYNDYLGNSYNNKTGELDIEKLQHHIYERKEKISILLMGATGSGKSSLVNSFFDMDVAKAGDGQPITQHLERYEVKEKGLILWDTKGIEAADYENTRQQLIDDIQKGVQKAKQSGNAHDAPQVAWLCIKETSSRIEGRERDLLALARDNDIPTVVVFTNTQAEATEPFFKEACAILNKEFPFLKNRFVRVNSVSYKFMGVDVPVSGLTDLLTMTESCWFEKGLEAKKRILALRQAQAISQEIRLSAMIESAKTKVHIAAAAAGAAGLSPIPMSDAPVIAAIQSGMIYSINSEFELDSDESYMTTFVTGVAGLTAVAQVGKALVTSALKFIPVVGTIAGGAISGVVAAGITEAIGQAYIAVLEKCFNMKTGKVELPESAKILLNLFAQQYKMQKK